MENNDMDLTRLNKIIDDLLEHEMTGDFIERVRKIHIIQLILFSITTMLSRSQCV
jgi:hypothetical protein